MKHFCPWLTLSSAGTFSKGIGTWQRVGSLLEVTDLRAEVIESASAPGIRGINWVDESQSHDTDSDVQIGSELRRSCR
jgi:hypothetical protein